ncbi:hypothetical protein SLS57_009751 [Botryosphaeria dothidea]
MAVTTESPNTFVESAAIYQIEQKSKDGEHGPSVFDVTQLAERDQAPKNPRGTERDWELPIIPGMSVYGHIDTENWSFSVGVSLMGYRIPTLYGDLEKGVVINVNQLIYNGTIRFNGEKRTDGLYILVDVDLRSKVLPDIIKKAECKVPFTVLEEEAA